MKVGAWLGFLRPLVSVLAFGAVLMLSTAPREVQVFEEAGHTAATLSRPVFYVKTDQKAVALTFDISWGTKTPPLVLSVLEKMNQKATFFLSGPWARRNQAIVKTIADAGHEIASHGEDHVNLSTLGKDAVADNIQKAHLVLREIAGAEARFFRPPNGDYDDTVVQTAKSLGYETIIWSVDSLDWKNPGVFAMISRVTRLVHPGAIILFHASDSSRETHLALPETLTSLKDAGYKVVTLGDLWKMGEPGRDDPRGRP
jgi:polysaccharide deacetylase family sporulation protein PdaB